MALFPVELDQTIEIENSLGSTSTTKALSANQGYQLRKFLQYKGKTVTKDEASGDFSITSGGQIVCTSSIYLPADTYSPWSTLHYGDYYYVPIGHISNADLSTVLNNYTLPTAAGSVYVLGNPIYVQGSTISATTTYLFKPSTGLTWYVITNMARNTSTSSITLANPLTLFPTTRVWSTNLI